MRQRSCFCLTCMSDLIEGSLDWGEMHNVAGCDAKAGSINAVSDSASNLYCFDKCECTKTAGPGVAAALVQQNKNRDEVASALTVGDWVVFDACDDELEPVWLGRVMSNPKWDGQGIKRNNTSRMMSYDNGVKVGKGEVGVFVIWYEKINVMSDDHEYWVSRTETQPIVQNNKYLIPLRFEMRQMLGEKNSVPKLRTSTRSDASRSSLNNTKRIEDWHDKEYGVVWKMDNELRRTALALSIN